MSTAPTGRSANSPAGKRAPEPMSSAAPSDGGRPLGSRPLRRLGASSRWRSKAPGRHRRRAGPRRRFGAGSAAVDYAARRRSALVGWAASPTTSSDARDRTLWRLQLSHHRWPSGTCWLDELVDPPQAGQAILVQQCSLWLVEQVGAVGIESVDHRRQERLAARLLVQRHPRRDRACLVRAEVPGIAIPRPCPRRPGLRSRPDISAQTERRSAWRRPPASRLAR